MHRFFKHISGLADYRFEREKAGQSCISFPIQLAEDAERFIVRTLAPGMKQKDIDIVLSGQTLTITGQFPCRAGNYLRQEWPCGTFSRSVELGCRVNSDAVEARLETGVLTISLPKRAGVKTSRVQVKYGS